MQNPVGESRYAGIDAGVSRGRAGVRPRVDPEDHVVVEQWAAVVPCAGVATADVEPVGAHHVVSDVAPGARVALSAGVLVDGPDLDVTQLIRGLTAPLE